MPKYWVAVASQEHVLRGVQGGFCQVCHGKEGPLKRMSPGDFIVYYSPTFQFGEPGPCRQFTAIGQIDTASPYQFQMSNDFIPWRRNVKFAPCTPAAIEPILDKLSFIKDKRRWGFPFRRGLFEISKEDFSIIALHMGIIAHDKKT